MRWRRLFAAVSVIPLLGSCTTVPNSSTPQVIHSVDVGQAAPPVNGPERGDLPRTIIDKFLSANAAADTNHNGARSFLTRDAKNRWSDTTGTTIIDSPQIGNFDGGKVTVSGREVGTIAAAGIYTPTLRGDGNGTDGVPVKESFGLAQVDGEWRINQLQPGLLISEDQFQQYQQRVLYFFDVAERHLVPDPRYTQISDQRDLAQWLVAGLAGGPRDGLQTELPNQADPECRCVTLAEGVAKIEIPGSGALPSRNRDRLAAQVARTLGQAQIDEIQITDGGRPVRIPVIRDSTFSPAQFVGQFAVIAPPNDFYYLRDGAVYDDGGRRMPGKVGTGAYSLTAVALSARAGSSELEIAALRADSKQEYLDIGSSDQLFATHLHGQLSRPAWAPDVAEVWIGSGPNLYRVSPTGAVHAVSVDKVNGNVTAVRLSPEGSRVALVLTAADRTSQIYVGSVVRSGSDVRVANLVPISPQGVAVRDVAWNDELKLFAIGTDVSTHNWGLYEVQCDGSRWTLRNDSGLPRAPDTLTVTANSVAVVSTGETIWQQQAGSWESPVGLETPGTNPVYIE